MRAAGAGVPILLLTSRDDAEARAEALRCGADECLTRPVHTEELIARAEPLLRRPGEWQRVDRVQVGPLQVDAARNEARVYGSPLSLRRKEFDFLYLLADRRPAVVTREMLSHRVWGGAYVSENSIDVTTAGLRSKIEDALPEESSANEGSSSDSSPSGSSANGTLRPRTETIRGVGYRLALELKGHGPTSEA